MSSFHVDARIDVKLEYELAVRLGEFIVNSGTVDKQILALGYKLFNMDEENPGVNPAPNKRYISPSQESSIASDWQDDSHEEHFSNEESRAVSTTMRDKVYGVKRRSSADKIRWGHQ